MNEIYKIIDEIKKQMLKEKINKNNEKYKMIVDKLNEIKDIMNGDINDIINEDNDICDLIKKFSPYMFLYQLNKKNII